MVKDVLLLILLFTAIDLYAQDNETPMLVPTFSEEPIFGGDLEAFILSHIHYPESAVADSIEGRVSVIFTIDTLGGTFDHEVIRGIRDDLDQEALRVARLMRFDTPAMFRNKATQVRFSIPVNFYLKYKDGIVKDDGDECFCKQDYTNAPSLRKVSIKQVNDLCNRLEKEYGGQGKYFPISIFVDDSGKPSCVLIDDNAELNDQLKEYILTIIMNLKFNPAKYDGRNVEGRYLLLLRHNDSMQRWFYPYGLYYEDTDLILK